MIEINSPWPLWNTSRRFTTTLRSLVHPQHVFSGNYLKFHLKCPQILHSVGFDIYIIPRKWGKVVFTLLGDGGYINWCFSGYFQRDGKQVSFNLNDTVYWVLLSNKITERISLLYPTNSLKKCCSFAVTACFGMNCYNNNTIWNPIAGNEGVIVVSTICCQSNLITYIIAVVSLQKA